jgi:cytochrome c oxidase subunit 4
MSHAASEAREHKPHVLPIRIYAAVWIGLLVLTVITVKVSYLNLGVMNLVVAMAVATMKASLVVLFFMHLKYDEKFNAIVFSGCLAFLFVFFVLTLADTTTRGKVDPLEARTLVPVPARPELGGATSGADTAAAHGASTDSVDAHVEAADTAAAPETALPDSAGPGTATPSGSGLPQEGAGGGH